MPIFFAIFMLPPVIIALIVWTTWAIYRKDPAWRSLLAAIVLACSCEAFMLWSADRQAHYWDGVDENPVVTQEEMTGTWRYKNEWIKLSPGGTFETHDGLRGTWSVKRRYFSSQSTRSSETGKPIVAIRDNGKLVLLKPSDGDPDTWIRGYAFARDSQ